jgi:hypothetical protein
MSVEVGIINKNAVCLSSNSKTVIHYPLSSETPVGIMIYSSQYLMGTHWESLVNQFRSYINGAVYDTMKDYSDRLIEFIKENISLFDTEAQEVYFFEKYQRFIENLREKASGDQTKLQRILEYSYERLKQKERLNLFETINNKNKDGVERYSELLNEAIDQVFSDLDLGQYYRGILYNIGRYMFSRGTFDNQSSGVIIAGYGYKDLHPGVDVYEIDSVIDNILVYRTGLSRSCGSLTDGNIYHFMINNIVPLSEEIDFNFIVYLRSYFKKIFNAYNDYILNTFVHIEEYDKVNLANMKNSIIQSFESDLNDFIEENYVSKMLASINLMSTDEMLVVARAMINMLDFKVREHQDDILLNKKIQAVTISKMDGYIKHYD